MSLESNPLPLIQAVRRTTFIESSRLSRRLGVDLTIVSETFQHTGSFKFRAAYNVALSVPHRRIITASSGNFGQALAFACKLLKKSCIVVMPRTSAKVKIDAVREFGGEVDLIDVARISRIARVKELSALYPDAYCASPFDDPLVIAGNASLGVEIADAGKNFDVVIAPVGGGGLTAGLIEGLRSANSSARVYGVEPSLANDAARSLRAGQLVSNSVEPATMADGVRTLSVGQHNWPILRDGLAGIIEVAEEQIEKAVRLLFSLANLKVEPTGALSIAALLTAPETFRGKTVCCVASGGNVDPQQFLGIIARGSSE